LKLLGFLVVSNLLIFYTSSMQDTKQKELLFLAIYLKMDVTGLDK